MTFWTLTLRSLRYRWKSHLGVWLGAMLGSGVLIGALIVGESVRQTLRDLGLQRLVGFALGLSTGDRFYRSELFTPLEPHHTLAGYVPPFDGIDPAQHELTAYPVSLLHLPGTMSRQDGQARANRVEIYGVPLGGLFRRPASKPSGVEEEIAWEHRVSPPLGTVLLNRTLAGQLQAQPGDELVLRLHKPSALSRDAVITPRDDQSVALRLRVHGVVEDEEGGNLSLSPSQVPPMNAFVRLDDLDHAAGVAGRVNLTLIPSFAPRDASTLQPKLRSWLTQIPWSALGLPNWGSASTGGETDDRVAMSILSRALPRLWQLPDAELELRETGNTSPGVELISRRIFIEDSVRDAVLQASNAVATSASKPAIPAASLERATPILTYLVNQIRTPDGAHTTPYSMITAAGAPWVPADLKEDEIVLTQWLAEDLQVQPGAMVEVAYYLLDSGTQLAERTNRFRVRSVVPIEGVYADKTLMPEFPGLTTAESTRDWDAGFKLVHPIRDKDEAYWKRYRGTPKAYVSVEAGQKLWANRFGRCTAIRFPVVPGVSVSQLREAVEGSVLSALQPSSVGLQFRALRQEANRAAADSQDFGGLFIGFSFFLIVSALMLIGLLFQFAMEQRQQEVGMLLAVGFPPSKVRTLFLEEALVLSALGALVGLAIGVGYAKGMLWGLGTLWKDAVGTSSLRFHLSGLTALSGVAMAMMASLCALFVVIRKQGRRPARALLAQLDDSETSISGVPSKSWAAPVAGVSFLAAVAWLGTAVARHDWNNPEVFFGASSLLLVAGLAGMSWKLVALRRQTEDAMLTRRHFLWKGMARRHTRSLTAAALLASGSFLILAIGSQRLDASREAATRSGGTGGFSLMAESSLPILRDLNAPAGREALGLQEDLYTNVSFVPFKLNPGDDASCLNLNRAQRPRLLGVKPALLADRNAFAFSAVASGFSASAGWKLLEPQPGTQTNVIPAIGDAASIAWALGKKLGDTLEFQDEKGERFQVQLLAGLANSVLQGSLVVDERELAKRFPSLAGSQVFLIDAPAPSLDPVRKDLSRGLRDFGFEVETTVARLSRFNGVQNTYLNTFQLLGGLGLLLGSAGLGAVLLRNALERRNEFAVLQALGYSRAVLCRDLLKEHLLILAGGLVIGTGAACVALVPSWLAPDHPVPVIQLATLLIAVFATGMVSTYIAARASLHGSLLSNLRPE